MCEKPQRTSCTMVSPSLVSYELRSQQQTSTRQGGSLSIANARWRILGSALEHHVPMLYCADSHFCVRSACNLRTQLPPRRFDGSVAPDEEKEPTTSALSSLS